MAITQQGRRNFRVGFAVVAGIASTLVLSLGTLLAAPGDLADPFDTVPQASPAQPPASNATPPAPTTPTAPAAVPSNPASAAQPPGNAGSLPENPFGEAAAQSTDNTAPQTPHDTMPGAAPSSANPGDDAGKPAQQPGEYSASQQEVKTANELINAGKYEEALEHLNEAIKQNPDEAAAYLYHGVADRMLNRYDDAIDSFTKAIQLANQNNQLDPEAYLRRGVVWFYKGEYGIAWQDFDEASAILYDDPRPELWKGLARAKQQNWLDAINCYAVALQHDDKFAPAWVNLGLGYLALNQPDKAVYCLDQAVRMEPRNAGSYFKRGLALSRLGKFREAADSYSEAIRVKPDYAEAYYNRGLVNRDLGNTQQAAKDHAQALKLNPQIEQQLTSTG